MAAWAGFSDADLRKVKGLSNTNQQKPVRKTQENVKKAKFGQERQDRPTQKYSTSNLGHNAIDPSMKLQQIERKQQQEQSNNTTTGGHKIPREMREESQVEDSSDNKSDKGTANKVTDSVTELDDKDALNRDMKSLENFRTHQKAIEEANIQKKALLAKTLIERKKRATMETYKLEHIQKELSKLDNLLTADVTVIRNKIEEASRDFLDAQRRFEKAESEYISSKIDLHSKSELKEQLTEHLYTIIHQNELRKAQKLANLMKELEMENLQEDFQLPELPPLSSFQPAVTSQLSPTGSKPVTKSQKLNDCNKTGNVDVSQIPQNGKESVSEIPQTGNVSVSEIPQTGNESVSEIPQTGNESVSEIPQTGNVSVSAISQTGYVSVSQIPQTGNVNVSEISQTGKGQNVNQSCGNVSTLDKTIVDKESRIGDIVSETQLASKEKDLLVGTDVQTDGTSAHQLIAKGVSDSSERLNTVQIGDTTLNSVETLAESKLPDTWVFSTTKP